MQEQPEKNTETMTLRFPEGWRTALKIAAARNHRSVNSELIYRLRPSVDEDIEREGLSRK